MHAIQIERFGGPEVLDAVEMPELAPVAGKVMIDVTAAGINCSEMTGGAVFTAALEPFGRLVHYGSVSREPAPAIEPRGLMTNCTSVIGFWLMLCTRKILLASLEHLWVRMANSELQAVVGTVDPPADARLAHEDLRGRDTLRKLALDLTRPVSA